VSDFLCPSPSLSAAGHNTGGLPGRRSAGSRGAISVHIYSQRVLAVVRKFALPLFIVPYSVPFRSALTFIAEDLMTPGRLPLFHSSPNARGDVGTDRHRRLPKPRPDSVCQPASMLPLLGSGAAPGDGRKESSISNKENDFVPDCDVLWNSFKDASFHGVPRATAESMYRFVGKILGVSLRQKFTLPVHMSSTLWKQVCPCFAFVCYPPSDATTHPVVQLSGERYDVHDIARADEHCARLLQRLSAATVDPASATGGVEQCLEDSSSENDTDDESVHRVTASGGRGTLLPDFASNLTDGTSINLWPCGGSGGPVRAHNAAQYVQLLLHARLSEAQYALQVKDASSLNLSVVVWFVYLNYHQLSGRSRRAGLCPIR
jgi:hypothetical protein